MNLELKSPHRRQRGFTLLEILISVLVLAIGLLGLAGLQAFGLRNGQSAYYRTMATIQAYDLADRMRANPTAAAAGSYIVALDDRAPSESCVATSCDSATMALFDLGEWLTLTRDLLPSGNAEVVEQNGIYTITILWDDARTGATGTGCDPDDEDDLICFSVEVQP